MQLRSVDATRYVMPLREGGSLPGLVEGEGPTRVGSDHGSQRRDQPVAPLAAQIR